MTKFNLDDHIVALLRDEPFFAALSRRMEKVPTRAIPTAGVCFNEDKCRFELLYNEAFMSEMFEQDPKFVKGVLLHEFYHIMLLHVTTRLPFDKQDKTKRKMTKKWNIATDLAINSDLTTYTIDGGTKSGYRVVSSMLPLDRALIPGVGPYEELPPNLAAEQYMELVTDEMMQQSQTSEQGQGGEGEGDPSSGGGGGDGSDQTGNGFDDHSEWGGSDGTDETRKIAEERLKEAVKDAFSEAQGKGFGSVSASMRGKIKEAITPKVNWRAVLRSFVKKSQRAAKTSTIKRLNRRYAYIHPGRKADRQAKIAVSIDQSGSVSDAMLGAFYSELEKLAQLAEFTIVPFDTQVSEEHVHVWKRGERREKNRYLTGGTCFNAPTKWVNERGFDGHIILTDMEAPKPIPSKCQRMWMTTKHHAQRPYFQTNERVIAIDE